MAVSKKSKRVIDPGTFSSIIKRNGATVPSGAEKIHNVIFKANIQIADERTSDDALNKLTSSVIASTPVGEIPTVGQIQDKVEEKLIAVGYAKTAKVYIVYRAGHTEIREMDQNLMRIYKDLTFKPSTEVDLKRENVDIDADTAMGTMLKYGSEGTKRFYNACVLPLDIAQAHHSGGIHIRDVNFYTLTETCCQIDLIKLFHDGFSTGHGLLRKPNNIRSYAALAYIAIQANQNEMHGGQSVSNFDYAMAVGVAKTFRRAYLRTMIQYLHIKMKFSLEDAALLMGEIRHSLTEPVALDSMDNYHEAFSS